MGFSLSGVYRRLLYLPPTPVPCRGYHPPLLPPWQGGSLPSMVLFSKHGREALFPAWYTFLAWQGALFPAWYRDTYTGRHTAVGTRGTYTGRHVRTEVSLSLRTMGLSAQQSLLSLRTMGLSAQKGSLLSLRTMGLSAQKVSLFL